MGLSIMSPLPDLRQENDNLHRAVRDLTRRLQESEEALRQERQKNSQVESGVQEIRAILSPLFNGLKRLYGEIDLMEVGQHSSTQVSSVWESWKAKLGGQTAEAIDVLTLHGEMNAEQLRIHLRCARTHVYNVISKLNKAGIVNKNGGKISLKEL